MDRNNQNRIKDIEQLMKAIGTNNLQKTVYKYTDCGAWIDTETEGQITMGSIVEGVDQCTETYTLIFGKFTLNDFNKALDQIEDEAKQMKPDYYLLLPWHFREGILRREKTFLDDGGKFIIPFPEIEII